jgi:CDP-glucose 4,6-dehydratase
MSNLNSFFYKKKILITGHTGFKGSWLILWLKNYDAKIFGISKDIPTKPSHFCV